MLLTNRPFTCTYCRVIVYDGQPGVESYARTPQVRTTYLQMIAIFKFLLCLPLLHYHFQFYFLCHIQLLSPMITTILVVIFFTHFLTITFNFIIYLIISSFFPLSLLSLWFRAWIVSWSSWTSHSVETQQITDLVLTKETLSKTENRSTTATTSISRIKELCFCWQPCLLFFSAPFFSSPPFHFPWFPFLLFFSYSPAVCTQSLRALLSYYGTAHHAMPRLAIQRLQRTVPTATSTSTWISTSTSRGYVRQGNRGLEPYSPHATIIMRCCNPSHSMRLYSYLPTHDTCNMTWQMMPAFHTKYVNA